MCLHIRANFARISFAFRAFCSHLTSFRFFCDHVQPAVDPHVRDRVPLPPRPGRRHPGPLPGPRPSRRHVGGGHVHGGPGSGGGGGVGERVGHAPPRDPCGHAHPRKGGMVGEKRLGHSSFPRVAGGPPGVAGRPAHSRPRLGGEPFRNHGHAHRGQAQAWPLCHLPHHWPRSLPHEDGHDCHQ